MKNKNKKIVSKTTVDSKKNTSQRISGLEKIDANPKSKSKNPITKLFLFTKRVWKYEIGILLLLLIVSLSILSFVKINSISGTVLGIDNKPVRNAIVKINGSTTMTDSFGNFRFGGVTQNPVDITIETKNYELYTDQLFRGRNFLREFTINLDPLDFSFITGRLILDGEVYSNEDILDGFSVNNENVDVEFTGDSFFVTGNLETIDSQLVIDSNLFDKVELDLSLIPGENNIGDVEIVRNEKINVEILDWSTNQPISGVNTEFGETDDDGKVQFTNLEEFDDGYGFEFSAKGYSTKTIKKSELTESIELVPVGRFAYSSEKEGINNLFSANFDGTDEKKISDQKILSSIIDGDNIYYTTFSSEDGRGEDVYSIKADGTEQKKLNTIVYNDFDNETDPNKRVSTNQKIDLESKKIITVIDEYDLEKRETLSKITTSNLDGSEVVVIRNRVFKDSAYEVIVSDSVKISADNKRIAYTIKLQENVGNFYFRSNKFIGYKMYDVDIESGEFDEVYKDENEFDSSFGNPVFYAGNSNKLVYSQRDPKGNITRLRVWDSSKKENDDITGLPNGARFQENSSRENTLALASVDNQNNLFELDLESLSTKKITDNGKITNFEIVNNLIYYTTDDDSEIYVYRGGESEKLNISSNGQSWNYNTERFGGFF